MLSALTLGAMAAAVLSACGGASEQCRASYVLDEGAWLAGSCGAPYWDDPSTTDPGYYDYTDPSGDVVNGDPSVGDPSSGDPYSGDPYAGDPGSSDPGSGSSDPGSSDPGSSDSSAQSLARGASHAPAATIKLRPDVAPVVTDGNGCYRCALNCPLAASPSTIMVASGASDTGVGDACVRAQRAILSWSASTGSAVGPCTPRMN